MRTLTKLGLLLALTAPCSVAVAVPPVPAFTARYQLLQNGSPIGTATVTLKPSGDGTWTYTTDSRGTAGLASLVNANVAERSTFRWVGDLPQGISYDYALTSALKNQHRSVTFDWSRRVIDVDDKGSFHFPTQPGALERHTVPLALAAGLAAGKTTFDLPVAVRDRIEVQHYAAGGQQQVHVPAGAFNATRVARSDGGDGIAAWFVPGKVPVPVKLTQGGKNTFSLELESWSH